MRFARGSLFHLLKNRTYLGEIPHLDRTYPGAHPPIVDAAIFAEAQSLLTTQARRHATRPRRVSAMPLRGLLFDDEGHAMSPTFTHGAKGQVYRYYVSAPLQCGEESSGSDDAIRRVPASPIEALVQQCVADLSGRKLVSLKKVVRPR